MLIYAPLLVVYAQDRVKARHPLAHRSANRDSTAAICARFHGKVFEVPAGTKLREGEFLLSERQGEQGAMMRLLCDAPPPGGVPATPGLEDAFLAIYREGTA